MKVCLATRNTVDNDRRTLKESAFLAESGLDVIVVGLRGAQHETVEIRDGFCIKRVGTSLGLHHGFTHRLYLPVYERLPVASRKLAGIGYAVLSLVLRALDYYSKPLVIYVSLFRAMLAERAEYYHSHFPLTLLMITFLAAKVRGAKYVADFNDVLVMNDHCSPQSYYEQLALWGQEPTETVQKRIETTIDLIPRGLRSVIDVGCGDGRIANRLASMYTRLVGVDSSKAALRYVRTEALRASITNLPFRPCSFDMVMTTEVLEHLPKPSYLRAIQEMKRVAAEWILVGVPLDEQLSIARGRCPRCRTKFHVNYHFRSFGEHTIRELFAPEYEVVRIERTGTIRRNYVRWLLWLKQNVGGIWARTATTVCPTCGSRLCPSDFPERNAIQMFCDKRNQKITGERSEKSHIVGLYRRT